MYCYKKRMINDGFGYICTYRSHVVLIWTLRNMQQGIYTWLRLKVIANDNYDNDNEDEEEDHHNKNNNNNSNLTI